MNQEALLVAQAVRGEGQAIPLISEIEAAILEKIGDIAGAVQLTKQLIQLDPGNLTQKIYLISLLLRQGSIEEAKKEVKHIDYSDVKDNSELLLRMAHICLRLEMPNVLRFAYRARQIASTDAEVHARYMHICLEVEPSASSRLALEPDTVSVDCAVHLKLREETLVILIEQEPFQPEPQEIGTDHPFANKLMGKKTGDIVILKEGPFGSPDYRIDKIQSKFVHAFQQSMKMFEAGWMNSPYMVVANVTEPEFIPKFLANLDLMKQQGIKAETAYRERQIPLCILADIINKPEIDLWLALWHNPEGCLIGADGTQQEQMYQNDILTNYDEVVLDLSAILTAHHLGITDVISRCFKNIYVAQAVLDTLLQYQNSLSGPRPTKTLYSTETGYAYEELNPNTHKIRQELVIELINFVSGKAKVLSSPGLLNINSEIIEAIGTPSAASIALAKDQHLPFYCDDLVLRLSAGLENQLPGISTQYVLNYSLQKGYINEDQYFGSVQKLILGNYQRIIYTAKFLIWALHREDMHISINMQRILATLRGPECDEDASLGIAVEVIKDTWLQIILYHQKQFILDAFLRVLIAGRNPNRVLIKFKALAAIRMHLMPLGLLEVMQSLDAWALSLR
jgi:transcription elongation GreA/GreB family factor